MLGRTICVALALGVASAFTPSRWVPARSTVSMGAAAPTMSKFERLQARWKGEPRPVDESKAGFGYDRAAAESSWHAAKGFLADLACGGIE